MRPPLTLFQALTLTLGLSLTLTLTINLNPNSNLNPNPSPSPNPHQVRGVLMNTPWRDDAASWRAVQLLEANAPLIRKEVFIYVYVRACVRACLSELTNGVRYTRTRTRTPTRTVKVARGLQAVTLCARSCNPMPASLPPHSGACAARARPAHTQLRLGQPGQARATGRLEGAELHLQGCAYALHARCMRAACAPPALHLRARIHTAYALAAPAPFAPSAPSQAHGTNGLWSCCLGPSRW